jgi:hypothetical protein
MEERMKVLNVLKGVVLRGRDGGEKRGRSRELERQMKERKAGN